MATNYEASITEDILANNAKHLGQSTLGSEETIFSPSSIIVDFAGLANKQATTADLEVE